MSSKFLIFLGLFGRTIIPDGRIFKTLKFSKLKLGIFLAKSSIIEVLPEKIKSAFSFALSIQAGVGPAVTITFSFVFSSNFKASSFSTGAGPPGP